MAERITPQVDIAFKKLFGVEENKDLLISLINSIVSKEDKVADIELLNPYNPRNFRRDKLTILDVKARSLTGELYNIEMQICNDGDYDKRALLYWAKLYSSQLEKSKHYSLLRKAIGIHILNFTSVEGTQKYHNVFEIVERDSKIRYFKDLELHTIELNKFEAGLGLDAKVVGRFLTKQEELNIMLPKIKTSLDRWSAFLTRHDLLEKDKLPKALREPELEKAIDTLEIMNFNRLEREAYEDHLKWLQTETAALKKAGEDAAAKRDIEIATNLIKLGVDEEIIAQASGVDINIIKQLKMGK